MRCRTYSMPSDVTTMDRNHDGFTDRLYVGDTGGRMWRFDVGSASTTDWTSSAKIVFWANPGTADVTGVNSNGRKIFYRPAVTSLDANTTALYFGTGDRPHPQNYLNPGTTDGAVVDRIYMVEDRDNDQNSSPPSFITESNLVDVTDDYLQQDPTQANFETKSQNLLDQLYHYDDNWSKYGWYIKLNAGGHDGEKVLASPSVFNGAAFFTTYSPNATTSIDPCHPGNLGTSRLYALDYRTGEAVLDSYTQSGTDTYGESQDPGTDAQSSYDNGARFLGQTKDGTFYVLRRADRETTLGGGLPTGPTFIIGKDGSTSALLGSGGSFPSIDVNGTGMVFPLYWMQW